MTWIRILGAQLVRVWLTLLRYPAQLVGYVVQPVAFLAPLVFLMRSFTVSGRAVGFEATTGTADTASFLLLGLLFDVLVSAAFWGFAFPIQTLRRQGVLEAEWVTPNAPWMLVVLGGIAQMTASLFMGVIAVLVGAGLFGFSWGQAPFLAGGIVALAAAGLFGFGIGYAGVVLLLREATQLTDAGSYATTTLSGSQFPVKVLPPALRVLALALPTTYGLDALRVFWLGTEPLVPTGWAAVLVAGAAAVSLLAGIWFFSRAEMLVKRRGTLGQF
ncbi:ABC transporter permease [Limnochorda pilosa]|uniref:ABC transporter n=1 Tax=Limnochorda pilosa TaxID=1555112 RepID=A0A0K2SQB9_LIMPI|nr:ABC transporter permease [Limnochorda pilosa]BAS29296.1 ABC transporter [Limnochorda pilosa]